MYMHVYCHSGYCSRKIKRLRKALHIPQGDRRHFKKKDVTEDMITEEKYIHKYKIYYAHVEMDTISRELL
jgi:RNA-binding signal recognition particle 68